MIARIVLTVFAVLSAVMPVWAGGPGDNPTCFIAKKTNTALVGTISANVQNAITPGNTDVDFTLRLSGDGGKTFTFFRASVNMTVFSRSNEGIICGLLFDPAPQAALDLRAAILNTFGLSPTAQFFITTKSVTNFEIQGSTGQWFCNNTFTDPTVITPPTPCPGSPAPPAPPILPRGGSMADVILYVQ